MLQVLDIILAALIVIIVIAAIATALRICTHCKNEQKEAFYFDDDEVEPPAQPISGKVAPKVLNEKGQDFVRQLYDNHNVVNQMCKQGGVALPPVLRPTLEHPSHVCSLDMGSRFVANDCTRSNKTLNVEGAVKDVVIDPESKRCNLVFEGAPAASDVRNLARNLYEQRPGLRFMVARGYAGEDVRYMEGRDAVEEGLALNLHSLQMATKGTVSPGDGMGDGVTVMWEGYFESQDAGHYIFYMTSEDASYMWLGEHAEDERYSTDNALIRPPRAFFEGEQRERRARVELDADTSYRLRILFGDDGSNRRFQFGFETPAGNFRIYDGKGYYYQDAKYVDVGGEVELDEKDGLQFQHYDGGYFDGDTKWTSTRSSASSGYAYDMSSLDMATAGELFNQVSGVGEFTVEWTGFFESRASGPVELTLTSKDASYLWMGKYAMSDYKPSNALVNNGGKHAMRRKQSMVYMQEGKRYPIRLMYGSVGSDRTGDPYFSFQIRTQEHGVRISNLKGQLFPTPGHAEVEWGELALVGLTYKVYDQGYFSDSLDFFSGSDPTETGQATNFGSVAAATEGGIRDGHTDVSVMWTGIFRPPCTGTYLLHLNSSDASYLWLGKHAMEGESTIGNALLDNGGTHDMKHVDVPVHLEAEENYPIRMVWGNSSGISGLRMSFELARKGNKVSSGMKHFLANVDEENQYKKVVEPLPTSFSVSVKAEQEAKAYSDSDLEDGHWFCSKDFEPTKGMEDLYNGMNKDIISNMPHNTIVSFRPRVTFKFVIHAQMEGKHSIEFAVHQPNANGSASFMARWNEGGESEWRVPSTGNGVKWLKWSERQMKAGESGSVVLRGTGTAVGLGSVRARNLTPVYEHDIGNISDTISPGKTYPVMASNAPYQRSLWDTILGRNKELGGFYIHIPGFRRAATELEVLAMNPHTYASWNQRLKNMDPIVFDADRARGSLKETDQSKVRDTSGDRGREGQEYWKTRPAYKNCVRHWVNGEITDEKRGLDDSEKRGCEETEHRFNPNTQTWEPVDYS